MASIKGWELKSVKSHNGMEDVAVSANIYYNGTKVGTYEYFGDGGSPVIDIPRELESVLDESIKSHYAAYPIKDNQYNIEPDADIFFGDILSLLEDERTYKKFLKKGYPVTIKYMNYGLTEYTAFTTVEAAKLAITRRQLSDVTIYTSLNEFTF